MTATRESHRRSAAAHCESRASFRDDGSLDGTAEVHARLAAAAPGAVPAITGASDFARSLCGPLAIARDRPNT